MVVDIITAIVLIVAVILVALLIARKYTSSNVTGGGDDDLTPEEQWGMKFAQSGFRPFYWYKAGERKEPPPAPPGVEVLELQGKKDQLLYYATDTIPEDDLKILADPEGLRKPYSRALGRALGYLQPVSSLIGGKGNWVWWKAVKDKKVIARLWGEKIEDLDWQLLDNRYQEINSAVRQVDPEASANLIVQAPPDRYGNAY